MTVSNNKTTHLVATQVPQFVRDDHETFVMFLEEYYSFLSQEGQAEYVAKNFNNYLDVDTIKSHIEEFHHGPAGYETYHVFLRKMYDNFIKLIPSKSLGDKAIILKHVKDFYRARGSEKSVRFLLRIFLGKEVNQDIGFYYPKRDILKASDGKWIIEKSIRIRDIAVDNAANDITSLNFISKTIRGAKSNATAIVETVDTYFQNGFLITELKISGTVRNFVNGEKVFCYYTEEGIDKLLSANLYSGVITSVNLIQGGSGYIEGSSVPVEGGGGFGGQIIISSVSKGALSGIGVLFGGAGFKDSDSILVSGGGGLGGSGSVLTVNKSEKYHPNTYQIVADQIYLEANTPIGNTIYSNLVPAIIDPANNWIANSMHYWSYANCGPIESCTVILKGSGYSTVPTLSAQANTIIRSMGILGRMQILNGGQNYQLGDVLEFYNPIGSYGSAASANVTNVDINGAITEVKFHKINGHFAGGEGYAGVGSTTGYDSTLLPTINVSTTTGNGANIIVNTLIGYGEQLIAGTEEIGKILSLRLISGGENYTTPPTINLANMAAGTNGIATSTIATGTYTYPGRYINDDGHLSSYNFLENRDYYQNYSYVVRVNASLKEYRKALKDLTHPAGLRLFGQYLLDTANASVVMNTETAITRSSELLLSSYKVHTSDALLNGVYNVRTTTTTYDPDIRLGRYAVRQNVAASYDSRNKAIIVRSPSHWLRTGDNVYLGFANATANITNGYYTITSANTNYFVVSTKNDNTTYVVLPPNTSSLLANTGPGYANTDYANNYIFLSEWAGNSNVAIKTGDSIVFNGNTSSIVYANDFSEVLIVAPAIGTDTNLQSFSILTAPYNGFGNVKIWDPIVTIFVTSNQITRDNVYFKFSTSDTTLSNGLYTLQGANSSILKINHRDVLSAASFSGNVSLYTKTVVFTVTDHGLVDKDPIFVSFATGDTANASNGLYYVSGATQNTFNIISTNTLTSSGVATYKTPNISITIAGHKFSTNDSVYMWFTSGDTANLDNGYHTVQVLNNSQFDFKNDTIPSSNGNVTVYRNFMNVTINRVNHGYYVNNTLALMFETGNLGNVSNGLFNVNQVANTNTYNVLHDVINITGDITNLLPNATGKVYVTVV